MPFVAAETGSVRSDDGDFGSGPDAAGIEFAGWDASVSSLIAEVEMSGEDGQRMQRLLDALEAIDDVQNVYTSAVIQEA